MMHNTSFQTYFCQYIFLVYVMIWPFVLHFAHLTIKRALPSSLTTSSHSHSCRMPSVLSACCRLTIGTQNHFVHDMHQDIVQVGQASPRMRPKSAPCLCQASHKLCWSAPSCRHHSQDHSKLSAKPLEFQSVRSEECWGSPWCLPIVLCAQESLTVDFKWEPLSRAGCTARPVCSAFLVVLGLLTPPLLPLITSLLMSSTDMAASV